MEMENIVICMSRRHKSKNNNFYHNDKIPKSQITFLVFTLWATLSNIQGLLMMSTTPDAEGSTFSANDYHW